MQPDLPWSARNPRQRPLGTSLFTTVRRHCHTRGRYRMFGPPSSAPDVSVHRFANDLADLADLDEKTVVSMFRGDDVDGYCAGACLPDLVGQAGRIEPVGVNRHDDQIGRHVFQGSLYAAAIATDVVGVHRLGEHQVGAVSYTHL